MGWVFYHGQRGWDVVVNGGLRCEQVEYLMLGLGYNGLELLLWWNMILGNGEWREPAYDYLEN